MTHVDDVLAVLQVVQGEAGLPRGQQVVHAHPQRVLLQPPPRHLHGEVRQRRRARRSSRELLQDLSGGGGGEDHGTRVPNKVCVLLLRRLVTWHVDQPDHDLQHRGLQIHADGGHEGHQRRVDDVERRSRGVHLRRAADGRT